MSAIKPFAPAAERNAPVLLPILQSALSGARELLEIGSGTGQHAVRFAAALPALRWQCSDCVERLSGLRAWIDEAALPNLPPPIGLEIGVDAFPSGPFDAVYTANTLHFMPWSATEALFAALPRLLAPGGVLLIYGPFRVGGRYLSANDPAFDADLRAAAPYRGLRDWEAVQRLAAAAGLDEVEVHSLPAENRCGVWRCRTPWPASSTLP